MDVFLSDFDSYSESSSSDDQEDDEFMYGGQASCILSNLQETIGKIDDFLLFERRYVPGDIVFSVEDQISQMGKVMNIEMVVDLENLNEKKLKDINSNNLQRIRSISTGEFVVLGPWVGKADHIMDSITVLFDDGIKCEYTMTGMEMDQLVPISPDIVDDYPYYPGQRVKAVNSTRSKSRHWFCGSQNEKQDEGTVCTVDAGLVHVTWLGCAIFDSERVPVPPSLQNSKRLTPFSCFQHSNWQIGDWCVLPKIEHMGFQEIFVVAKMKCKVDVLWQDGSESCGLDSSSLGPVNTVNAHDFWPHQFVLEKGTSDDQQEKKWGVVKAVDANEKTVKVKWECGIEETVSAYELLEHPDYSYCQGDLVLRLHKGQKLENVEDTMKCSTNIYLNNIGIVIGFINGNVEVKWAAGFTSEVAPHEIFRVEKSESISATPLLNNDTIELNHEKSRHDDSHSPDARDKDLSDSDDEEKDCLKTLYDSTTFNVPRAAIGFLSNVAMNLFGFPLYTSLSATSHHVLDNESVTSFDNEKDNQELVETSSEMKLKEAEEFKNASFLPTGKNVNEIKQFDMVNDCSNHHFVDSPGKGSISSQVKKCWLKKVQQEWNILSNDLPETIYVRVFEERMDLMQAGIVGAPGTPYHDCLFFFDIFLPPDYPHEPPMVHYNSGGLRVNPNLYESGRVCLSLLNTWTGSGTETWNPNSSTVLQVLLSLQALVLNQKPYFNEAGYDQQVGSAEGEKNSCSYNENAFLMSCKSMLFILRNPPKQFEALVEEHFRKNCMHILMACKAYLEGIPVGCAFESQYLEPEGQKGQDYARLSRMSIVEEGAVKNIRVANLSVYCSHTVNGVSRAHSELIKTRVFTDFYELWPEKFQYKTNGVTQRRWIVVSNPSLCSLITKWLGTESWIRNIDLLARLREYATNSDLQQEWRMVKKINKMRLAEYIETMSGVKVSVDAMFDVQIKRIHAYKRQLLNILGVIHRYDCIKNMDENERKNVVPRVCIIGGKAPPGYEIAKKIIKLCHAVAETINNDSDVRDLLKLVFIPDYNVSVAELVIPGSDLSQHISTAGHEASGTGSMKFLMNGCLLLATDDGSTNEIIEEIGAENMFIFGAKINEVPALREKDSNVKAPLQFARVVRMVRDGYFGYKDYFKSLCDTVENGKDFYLVGSDFASYLEAQAAADKAYVDKDKWSEMSILCTAGSGRFSSDRTIEDYAEKTWGIEPCKCPF